MRDHERGHPVFAPNSDQDLLQFKAHEPIKHPERLIKATFVAAEHQQ